MVPSQTLRLNNKTRGILKTNCIRPTPITLSWVFLFLIVLIFAQMQSSDIYIFVDCLSLALQDTPFSSASIKVANRRLTWLPGGSATTASNRVTCVKCIVVPSASASSLSSSQLHMLRTSWWRSTSRRRIEFQEEEAPHFFLKATGSSSSSHADSAFAFYRSANMELQYRFVLTAGFLCVWYECVSYWHDIVFKVKGRGSHRLRQAKLINLHFHFHAAVSCKIPLQK